MQHIHARCDVHTPWTVLLEQLTPMLKTGYYGKLFEVMDRLVLLRGEKYRLLAPESVVLKRLWAIQAAQKDEPAEPMPAMSANGQWELWKVFYRLPRFLDVAIISLNAKRPIRVIKVLEQINKLIDAAIPSEDVTAGLPNEILIDIGHRLISDTFSGSDRDRARVSLSSVCQRWKALFSLGEFWTDLETETGCQHGHESLTPGDLARRARQKFECFLDKGALESVRMSDCSGQEELSSALEAMIDRSATVTRLELAIPEGWTTDRIWDVWTKLSDFHLESLVLLQGEVGSASPVSWSFPARLDFSTLTELRIEDANFDIRSVSVGLPNLWKLTLRSCAIIDPAITEERPVTITFPALRILEVDNLEDLECLDPSSATFHLPKVVDLTLGEDASCRLEAFLRPSPFQPCHHLAKLDIQTFYDYDDEEEDVTDDLIAILRRHPTLVELSFQVDRASDVVRALGADCCPALRVLAVPRVWRQPDAGAAVVAMVRSREAAAASGDEMTCLGQFTTYKGIEFTEEEKEWLRTHLQKLELDRRWW